MVVQPDLFADSGPRVYSVREINEVVRRLLEDSFGEVAVEGEISNAKLQASGHWYFTLKDEAAQLAAVLFRGDARELGFRLENGLHVRAVGRLQVYPPQGRYQLVARSVAPIGQGALELAFRQLHARLESEGLFDPARKRPLPRFPRRIAVVTSPTGAAVRDVLTTLRNRWPLASVLLVPAAVQGVAAVPEIVRAIALANRGDAEVLLVVRGGGSLEDLWAFNDERVARAIAASHLPVVTGIGHEVDRTIADFVADRRAATPTAAAAAVVPSRDDVRAHLVQLQGRVGRALRRRLELPRAKLGTLLRSYGLRRVPQLVPELAQTVDARLETLGAVLDRRLERDAKQLDALAAQLQALGPRRVLERGYTYCVDAGTRHVVARARDTRAGQDLVLHFADDTRSARVQGDRSAP